MVPPLRLEVHPVMLACMNHLHYARVRAFSTLNLS